MFTHVSQAELKKNRHLMWTKSGKKVRFFSFSVHTNWNNVVCCAVCVSSRYGVVLCVGGVSVVLCVGVSGVQGVCVMMPSRVCVCVCVGVTVCVAVFVFCCVC